MSSSLFGIPVDIQWKRMCFSEDMCAKTINDYPEKWRSSIAVFYSDVEPDPADTSGELTMFLKVVISITGYQPEWTDIDSAAQTFTDWGAVAKGLIDQLTSQYYPAYAAILQVLVVPKGKKTDGSAWSTAEYPYFATFEPKKRELIELATDTSEALTQSSTDTNIRKGLTTNDSQESIDISNGYSAAGSAQGGGGGGSLSGSESYNKGTRVINGINSENLRTIDNSIEKRESYAHQTQLSQLYHQLDTYHEGMNRALFFHNARPHTQAALFNTFVNGLRMIEGIQEHFLLVKRPVGMDEVCVKAILETAHISDYTMEVPVPAGAQPTAPPAFHNFALESEGTPAGQSPGGAKTDTMNVFVPAGFMLDPAHGNKVVHFPATGHGDDDGWDAQFNLPPGFEINVTQYTNEYHELPVFQQIAADQWQVSITIQGAPGAGNTNAYAVFDVTAYFVPIPVVATTATQEVTELFLTGRAVTNCPDELKQNDPVLTPSITFETTLTEAIMTIMKERKLPNPMPLKGKDMGDLIKNKIIGSFRNGVRYKLNEVDFYHSNLALNYVKNNLNRNFKTLDQKALGIEKLDPSIREKIARYMPRMTGKDFVTQDPKKLAFQLKLPEKQVRATIGKLMGLK
jgi:hypothetical protein